MKTFRPWVIVVSVVMGGSRSGFSMDLVVRQNSIHARSLAFRWFAQRRQTW